MFQSGIFLACKGNSGVNIQVFDAPPSQHLNIYASCAFFYFQLHSHAANILSQVPPYYGLALHRHFMPLILNLLKMYYILFLIFFFKLVLGALARQVSTTSNIKTSLEKKAASVSTDDINVFKPLHSVPQGP